MQIQVPGVARDFSPLSTFSANSLTVSAQPQCAIACINICVHVKNPRHCQPYHLFGHAQKLQMLIGIGGTALAAAVP